MPITLIHPPVKQFSLLSLSQDTHFSSKPTSLKQLLNRPTFSLLPLPSTTSPSFSVNNSGVGVRQLCLLVMSLNSISDGNLGDLNKQACFFDLIGDSKMQDSNSLYFSFSWVLILSSSPPFLLQYYLFFHYQLPK